MKKTSTFVILILTIFISFLPGKTNANFGVNGVHDPSSIIKLNGVYHIWGTGDGIAHMTSTDLVNWTAAAPVFPVGTWPSYINTYVLDFGGSFWAPECIFMNGKYYLYYSASMGGRNSVIGLTTSTDLVNWTDQGMVVYSDNSSTYGSIDPAVLADANNNYWMVFGSHLTGIWITQIDPATGKRLNSSLTNIAGSSSSEHEAGYIIYEAGYYYLFYNVGICCALTNSTYNVKMGRSTSPTGPYVDKNGVALLNGGGTQSLATSGKYIGPGHYGLLRENGRNILTMHYYDGTSNGFPRLDVASMKFGSDGWPEVSRDPLAAGRYTITNKNSNLAWEVEACTGTAGQKIVQNTPNASSTCQQWDLESFGNGFYRFKSAGSNGTEQVVDIPNCNTSNGTLLATWDWLNNDCQKFKIEQAANGSYVFSSGANADRVIEVPFASSATGAQLGLFDYLGNGAQQWSVTPSAANDMPITVSASNVAFFSFTANWSAVPNATGYKLDVYNANGTLTNYNNLSVNSTSQAVAGLAAGVTYSYRVRAVYPSYTSANSSVITVTTPSEAIDNGIHDPSTIVKEGNKYWMYGTGLTYSDGTVVPFTLAYSTDLLTWTRSYKTVFPKGTWPAWISTAVPNFAGTFWAPDITYMNGKYYLYYSASAFGSSTSVIGLATSPTLDPNSPDYLWTDQGMVVSSNSSNQANAIDAAFFKDTDGRMYLYYGSFSGGIAVVELDPATGLKKSGSATTKLAGGSGSAWEAPYLIKEGTFYYLYANRQFCCTLLNSTYYMVVGRSTSPTGPFTDKNGTSLNTTASGTVVGTTVLTTSGKFVGPGHFGLLKENGRNIISMHYYDGTSNGYPRVDLAALKYSDDGWPIITRDLIPDGRFKITNKNSGLVWETAGCTGLANQQLVQSTPNDAALCQQWDLTSVGDGYYRLKNANGGTNTQVVDIPFCDVTRKLGTFDWLNNDCQKFKIDQLANGSYVFSPLSNSSVVIEVPFASLAPNEQLGLFASNGCTCQQWSIDPFQSVPVAVAADSITPNTFNAKWSPAPNATSYTLDVSASPNFSTGANTTVAGWSFPNSTSVSNNLANSGVTANIGKTLTSGGGVGTPSYATVGNGGFTAMATGWNSGNATKYWEASNISTTGYYSVKVSSKQRSNSAAPRHFKLQYKIGLAGLYSDVPGSYVSTADNYTSGVLINVSLPSICDNQPSVYLRWLMITNTPVSNNSNSTAGTVASTGQSNIDDIVVTGFSNPGNSFLPGYDNLTVNGTTQTVSGLTPNTSYYYRVRSVIGGVTSNNSNIITVKTGCDAIVPNETITNVTCNGAGDGAISLLVSGGATPYTFRWTGPVTFTSTAQNITNLQPGDYKVVITEKNGCTAYFTYKITSPAVLKAASNTGTITCNGGSTTVTVSGSGGTAPYSGAETFTVQAGAYSFTVTDANGCTATTTGLISEPALLSASATAGTITCHGETTTVNVAAVGGTAPYQGAGGHVVSAGDYSFTVTDASGCSTIVSGTVTEPATLEASATAGTIACHGGTTTVNVAVVGGTAPYEGAGDHVVSAGNYYFTITDANGCSTIVSGTISEPDVLTASANAGTISCNGGTTSVTVDATGGTASYTGTGTYTVHAGPYSYTVTDANGCSTIVSGTISEPAVLTVSTTSGSIACYGETTTVSVVASGGTAPYSGTGTFTTGAGSYTYTVTDANGCNATTKVTLGQPTRLSGTIADVYAVSPGGNANTIYIGYGPTSVNLKVVPSGATPSYTYSWKVGTSAKVVGTGQTLVVSPAVAGVYNYTVTVTDSKGCTLLVTKSIKVVDVSCGNNKVTICKVPPGNSSGYYTECANKNEVASALSKGSYLGSCVNSTNSIVEAKSSKVPAVTSTSIKVYPNPSNGQFTVTLNNAKAGRAQLVFMDVRGAVIETKVIEKIQGLQNVKFAHRNLASGMYLIKVVTEDAVQTAPVIIVH